MGAVQFVLKGDKDEKKILSYNEKQRIYKEQSQILMSNFINDKGFQSDISRLTSGNISDKELNEIIDSYSPNNSNCKIKGLSYPKEAILTYAAGLLIQNGRMLEKNMDIFKYIQNIIIIYSYLNQI